MPVVERPCGSLFGMSNVTLTLDLAHWLPDDPPAPASVRVTTADDIPDLGRLYFKSYPPGVACATTEEAVADIEASFAGEYGEYWFEASPVGEIAGELVGAVMTVRQAPWDRTPEGHFIIELFTDPAHRQSGIARQLLAHALEAIRASGLTSVSLRVDADNDPAVTLYRSIGFVDWQSPS